MASIRGNLAAVGDVLGPIDVVDHMGNADVNGAGSLTLAAGAVGTVVLEVSPGQDLADADIWIQPRMFNPTPAVDNDVDSLVGAAGAQYARFELVGVRKVRARKTVTAGACFAILNMKAG